MRKASPGGRSVGIEQHFARVGFGVAGGEKLHAQLAGRLVIERQRGGIVRHHLADAGGKRFEQLANVHVGQQQAAQLGDHRLLRLLVLGHVARDFGKAGDGAGAVVNGREHDVGPEAGAVFAHAPSLFFHAILGDGLAQKLGGTALLHIFLRKEAREVQAEHLVGLVSLDALCAGVPGEDVAVAVQQIDGVLADALDDGTQPRDR